MGRSEIISKSGKVSSSYSCGVCCPNGFGRGLITPYTVFTDIGGFEEFTANQQDQDCYGNLYSWYPVEANWTTDNSSIASMDANIEGRANAMGVGETYIRATWDAEYFADRGSGACDAIIVAAAVAANMSVRPKVTNVTATGATKISQVLGSQNIIHFVTPKGAANSQVTLTATLSQSTQQILNNISWEGATESASNPLEATVSKDAASKNVVKIKYNGSTIKELRVWVVWATITSTPISISYQQVNLVTSNGNTYQGAFLTGGYYFTHTIQPTEIVANDNQPKPDFKGNKININGPPGGNHPIFGTPLSGGADKKWDNSRQLRWKIINPFNISGDYFLAPLFPSVQSAYPTDDVVGNDDASVDEPETNDPYTNNGILTGGDSPSVGLANIAGNNNETYEERIQFREFTRIEIEGMWYRISDYYLWRIQFKLKKTNNIWANDGSSIALDNNNF